MASNHLLDLLATTPDMRAMRAADARMAMAVRIWMVMNRLGRCPQQALEEQLGSGSAAAHLRLMLEEVGAAWPEPFCINPPCCPRLSHDEALVTDMVRIARLGDRPGFDRLLSDLIAPDLRDCLFLSASLLARATG